MKHKLPLFITLSLIVNTSYSQIEKELASTIKQVTIYSQGAQIEREASVALQPGQMVLKFTRLAPSINETSIRVDGDGSYTILNVKYQNDYLNELEKSKEIEQLEDNIETLLFKIEDEETAIKIANGRLDFLNANKEVAGKEQALNPETYKSLNEFYGSNLENLSVEILKKQRSIKRDKIEISKLQNQLKTLNSKTDKESGTILVTIDSRQAKTSKIKLSYLVNNAQWVPSYDIRFMGVNKPLKVTYKANIIQNTGIDWKDVNLVLSTAKTDLSAQIPSLSPFYLQFYYPQLTNVLQGRASGVQIQQNSGAPGVNGYVAIRGMSSIKTASPLYVVDGVPQNDISMLNSNEIDKIEVLKDASAQNIYGSNASNGVLLITTKKDREETSIPLTITSKQETTNEFIVDAVQTILSSDEFSTVSYRETDLAANFEYQSVPKLSQNVFLIGKITDWYKAELLDAEVNVYLENSFVGKSVINTLQFNDTLELSFGIDNNLSIKREKLSEFSENQIIGSNRTETIAYKITVRNNKEYPVSTIIYDQIPVTTTKNITVETLECSNGKLDKDSGKIEWKIDLKSKETNELLIKYSVKYPKDKKVITE